METPERVTAPEPMLGYYRYVVHLPAGAAAPLAFDGYVRELGNGWVDITPRIAAADGEDWVPLSLPDWKRAGGELLSARGFGWRHVDPGAGDILRELVNHVRVYWLFDGERWYRGERLAMPMPLGDDGAVDQRATARYLERVAQQRHEAAGGGPLVGVVPPRETAEPE